MIIDSTVGPSMTESIEAFLSQGFFMLPHKRAYRIKLTYGRARLQWTKPFIFHLYFRRSISVKTTEENTRLNEKLF